MSPRKSFLPSKRQNISLSSPRAKRPVPQPRPNPGSKQNIMGGGGAVAAAAAAVDPPDAPTITFTAGQEEVTLSVVAVPGATTYRFEFDDNNSYTSPEVVEGAALTATFSTLNPATTYYGRARASNSGGESAYDTDSGTPNSLAAPTFNGFSLVTDTAMTVTWDADVPNATSYTIEVGTATTLSDVGVFTGLMAPVKAALSGLTAGDTYYARCFAVGEANGTDSSEQSQATTAAQSSAITISVAQSSQEGVGPFGVYFDASSTTSTHTTALQHYRELDFEWSFGDSGAGFWDYGNQVSSAVRARNMAFGPQAAHVYATPGIYTVTLTVKAVDQSDNSIVTKVATFPVTVTDPDTVYAGTDTIAISSTTDWPGAPAGALQVATTNWGIIQSHLETADKRVLFRAGDTFTADAATFIADGVSVSSFGTGDPAIIISSSGTSDMWNVANGITGTRFHGLNFTGLSGPVVFPDSGMHDCFQIHSATDCVIYNNTIQSFEETGIHFNDQLQTGGTKTKNLFIHDNLISYNKDYQLFGGFIDSSIQGNHMHGTYKVGSHVCRIMGVIGGVIAHNKMREIRDRIRSIFTVRAPEWPGAAGAWSGGGEYSEKFVICDNEFLSEGLLGVDNQQSNWTVTILADNSSDDMRFRYYVFERNVIRSLGTADTEQNVPQACVLTSGDNAVIRSNIIDMTEYIFANGITLLKFGTNPVPGNIHVSYNTIYQAANVEGTSDGIETEDGTTNECRGNLIYMPEGGTLIDEKAGAEFAVQEDNTGDTVGTITTSPLFVGTPAGEDPAAYQPSVGSYAVDAGDELRNTFVWRDFAATLRDTTTATLGAWEN